MKLIDIFILGIIISLIVIVIVKSNKKKKSNSCSRCRGCSFSEMCNKKDKK